MRRTVWPRSWPIFFRKISKVFENSLGRKDLQPLVRVNAGDHMRVHARYGMGVNSRMACGSTPGMT